MADIEIASTSKKPDEGDNKSSESIAMDIDYGKYLANIPRTEYYEKSYQHRDVVTHIVVTKTNFIVTASIDGHLKFWKKMKDGIEFVKHFRSHLCKLLLV